MDFEGGEVEVKNGLGERLLWQRTWKKDGSPPPQQSMWRLSRLCINSD